MEKKPIKDKHFPDNLYRILAYLSGQGKSVELTDLRDRFMRKISKPVIKAILYDLSMQNFIEEKESKKDRRKKIIYLTDTGGELLQRLDALEKIM